ncbi:Glycine-rich rna binding protein [Mycena venus]|uniref:Glycine-rich rna binding protein n=1 Tax=Mycena venus TaxID=2733690 RepID=A0A8H6Y292_9AGAR|nr:Glycine-rich rna binding protein [Mycena venus]
MSKVYIGNLSWSTTDDGLRDAFSQFGSVTDYICMKDRETGRMCGFGFVTFSNEQEAQNAINAMHDQELDGRRLRVSLAHSNLFPLLLTFHYPGGYGGSSGGYGGDGYSSNNSYDGSNNTRW